MLSRPVVLLCNVINPVPSPFRAHTPFALHFFTRALFVVRRALSLSPSPLTKFLSRIFSKSYV